MKKLRLAVLLALPVGLGLYVNSVALWRPHTLASYREPVRSVAWMLDGKRLASVGRYRNVALWDVSKFQMARTFSAGPGEISDVAFSPDGKWVAVSLNDDASGYVRLWDARTGALKRTVIEQRGVSAVAFSGDSRTMANSTDGSITLRDAASAKATGGLYVSDNFQVQKLILSPDGHTIISLCEHNEIGWLDARKAAKNALRAGMEGYAGEGVDVRGNCAAFSPNGKSLAVGTTSRVLVYNVHTRGVTHRLASQGSQASALAFSTDGNTLAIGDNTGRIELWDVPSPKPLRELKGHAGAITSLAFAPDGNTLASVAGMEPCACGACAEPQVLALQLALCSAPSPLTIAGSG